MPLIVARAYRQIIHTDRIPNIRPRRIAGERFQWILEERKRRRSAEVQASAGIYNEWRAIGFFPSLETPHSGRASSSRSNELLGVILAANYSQIADHSNRVFYTTIVTSYAAVFSVA